MSDPFNPYAAPSAASADMSIAAGYGQPMPWTPSEVLSTAWNRFNTNWAAWFVLLAASIVSWFLGNFLSYAAQITIVVAHLDKTTVGGLLSSMATVLSTCFFSFFLVGLTRLFLDAARNRPLRFGLIFTGGDRWPAMIALQFLMGLAVLLGTILFIVPGIILALGLSLAQYYVVEANMGPTQAMRASWEATKGQRGQIFLLGLLSLLVVIAGCLACCVGILVAAPLVYLAQAIMFTRISGRDPVA